MRKFGLLGDWIRSLLVGPAGVTLVLLGTYLLILWFWQRRTHRPIRPAVWGGVGFSLVFLFLCLPYTGALLDLPLFIWGRKLEERYPRQPHPSKSECVHSAVLVLGGGVTDSGFLSSQTLDRIERALVVWKELPGAWFMVAEGGIGLYQTENRVRTYLERCGIPKDRILLETRSLTTQQNVEFALPILRKHAITEIVLVTNLRHLPRGYLVCRHYGLDTAAVGAYTPPSFRFCPSWRGLSHFSMALNEYAGLAGYRMLGWI